MSANLEATRTAINIAQVEKEAWTILELHFLSRPYLADEARLQLRQCLARLHAEGRHDARALKDMACRSIQMAFGPAPAMVRAPSHRPERRRLFAVPTPVQAPRLRAAAESHALFG